MLSPFRVLTGGAEWPLDNCYGLDTFTRAEFDAQQTHAHTSNGLCDRPAYKVYCSRLLLLYVHTHIHCLITLCTNGLVCFHLGPRVEWLALAPCTLDVCSAVPIGSRHTWRFQFVPEIRSTYLLFCIYVCEMYHSMQFQRSIRIFLFFGLLFSDGFYFFRRYTRYYFVSIFSQKCISGTFGTNR